MSYADIQPAVASDAQVVEAIVRDAYEPYVERMGRQPAPMTANYGQLIDEGWVWVLRPNTDVAGLIVLCLEADHVLVDNVAVGRAHHGRGLGRRLLDHAEDYARSNGVAELRLYTNELMHENLAIYAKLGWEEYDRRTQDGFRRVFLRKRVEPVAGDSGS